MGNGHSARDGPSVTDDPLHTVGSAARYLELSEATIRQWADSGRLECTKTVSGMRLIRQSDLDAEKARA